MTGALHLWPRSRATGVAVSLVLHTAVLAPFVIRPDDLAEKAGLVTVSLVKGEAATAMQAAAVPASTATLPSTAEQTEETPPTDVPAHAEAANSEALNAETASSIATYVATAAAAGGGANGEDCQIGGWLKGAIENSPTTVQALTLIPRDARSVANALMLWNGQWVEGVAGLSVIRDALLVGIRSAPPECLELPLHGPLLIPIETERETLILAVGSGVWTWAELLATSPSVGDLRRQSMAGK